jgi:cytochrome b561
MRLTNSHTGYGLVHWAVHWATAVLVCWLFYLGWTMVDLPLSPRKFQDYALHKSLGLTVLALVLLRIVWRRLNEVPRLPDGMARHETILAKATHHGIYVLLVVMPLTGWLYSGATASPANFFGFFTVPDLVPPNETLASAVKAVHLVAGYLLALAILLHVAGALKHHFVNRDTVLLRMLRPLKD